PPINFPRWIAENAHLLQPPVNNFCVWRSDFIIMALGGPNKRSDYHTNPTEEWFFQHKGDLLLKVVDRDGAFKDVWVREGDMLLVPGDACVQRACNVRATHARSANVPHNPVRFANTVGIVIEMKRPEGSNDSLSWFCEQCRALVYSESFYCYDLGTQLKPVIEKWAKQPELRVCKQCG
ncbi:3-hydroxyanthranilate 3,4-dioxygenase, partial [Zopfochytrium polystomum]